MAGEKKASKTLPFTMIFASSIFLLLSLAAYINSGKFVISPIGVGCFVATGYIVWKTWFSKSS